MQKRQRLRNERAGELMVANALEQVGETSPRDTSSEEGSNLLKSDLSHVQSTTWETTTNGDLACSPEVKSAQPISHPKIHPLKMCRPTCADIDNTGCSLAESVHIKTASSSDSDSLEAQERGNHPGTSRENSCGAHRQAKMKTLHNIYFYLSPADLTLHSWAPQDIPLML